MERYLHIGNKVFQYKGESSLLRTPKANVIYCPLLNGTMPPFGILTMKDGKIVDMEIAPEMDRCRFDPDTNTLSAVPWQLVLRWIYYSTEDDGKLFLKLLGLGTNKQILKDTKTKRIRNGLIPLARLLATFTPSTCICLQHQVNCNSSSIISGPDIDPDLYKNGIVMCKRCAMTRFNGSGDGFLNLSKAQVNLRHMERHPDYNHLIDCLLNLLKITKDQISYYRYGEFQQDATDFRLNRHALFNGQINLNRLECNSTTIKDFGCKSKKEFEKLLFESSRFYFFGKEAVSISLHDFLPPSPIIHPKQYELVVISVFAQDMMGMIFSDPLRHVISYALLCIDEWKVIAGVDSFTLKNMDKIPTSSTVVIWPSQNLSMHEVAQISTLKQKVILAGTPFLVPEKRLEGFFFTDLIEKGHKFTYYGPDTNISRYIDTYPALPIPTTLFSTDRHIRLQCPTYEENQKVYYNRLLLTKLVKNCPYDMKLVSIVPGELLISSLLGRASTQVSNKR